MNEHRTVLEETPDGCISVVWRSHAQGFNGNFVTADGNDVHKVAFLEKEIVRHSELLGPAECSASPLPPCEFTIAAQAKADLFPEGVRRLFRNLEVTEQASKVALTKLRKRNHVRNACI